MGEVLQSALWCGIENLAAGEISAKAAKATDKDKEKEKEYVYVYDKEKEKERRALLEVRN